MTRRIVIVVKILRFALNTMKKFLGILIILISIFTLRQGWFWVTTSRTYRIPEYSKLKSLLAAKQWKEADWETVHLMKTIAFDATTPETAFGNQWFKLSGSVVLGDFPCQELRQIDQLWREASGDRFGFTTQNKIWHTVKRNNYPDQFRFYDTFQKHLGWSDYPYQETTPPVGYFPTYRWMEEIAASGEPWLDVGGAIYQKLSTCNSL